MSFSMAPLLVHSADLPLSVRDELRAAMMVEPAQRDVRHVHLAAAARILTQQLSIDCSDARELVGLPTGAC